MRTRNFQNRFTTGRFTLPAVIAVAMACWLLGVLLLPPQVHQAPSGSGLWQSLGTDNLPLWLSLATSFLLHGLTGWILIELNNAYAIIRMRASVQTAFYLLFVSACPLLHRLHAGNVGAVACMAALYFLLGSYRHRRPESMLFYAFALLGTGSLAVPQLTLLAPVFWIGAYNFRALRFKSFCASLLGWWLPYWFLLGHAYFHGQMELFCSPFRELACFAPWSMDYHAFATLGCLFVVFAVATTHCLATGYEDKIRTRSYLHFLIWFCCYTFLFMTLQPSEETALLPMLLAGVSFPAGHLFVLTDGRGINYFFIAMFVGLFALFVFNLWMLS